ncbi:MAG: hypothetical protein NC300_02210 [Bacteroidales bacterium]|nr:hypothetical protein [Clostridium sp.]MCM1202939.1 hypothetical protein [Bacteroidales bacterium]
MKKNNRLYVKIVLMLVIVLAASLCSRTTSNAGWDNHRYYDQNGNMMTGWKKIGKKYYYFNEPGKLYNSRAEIGICLSELSGDVLSMGIDMSEWQGNVNWKLIKQSGIKFVMLRLGYGKGRYGNTSCSVDARFWSYVKGAQSVGLPIGVYFYSYAKTPAEAWAEAEFTIQQLNGTNISFPVAYDIEDPAILAATDNATRTSMVKTFLDTVESAGYTPMVYCNKNWYDNYLNSWDLKGYDFWYARYTYEEPDRTVYNCSMWQATSTQQLIGITQNTVDLNFLYKDYFSTITPRVQPLKHGWHKEGSKTYYYEQGSRRGTGWLTQAGNVYYLKNGAATYGWKKIKGNIYYFDQYGVMQAGTVLIKGRYFVFDANGVLQKESQFPGMTIHADGTCTFKKGWYKDAWGRDYYQYTSGRLAKNTWIKTGKKTYFCDGNGYRVTGFKTIDGKQYYFNKNGVMKTGWLTYKGKRYYFKKTGVMQTGWLTYKGEKYYFKKNGVMKTGWLAYKGRQYYLDKDGQMVKRKTIKIDGKKYTFDKWGRLKK